MVVRSVIQKFDGDDLITKEFTSTSDNRPCGSSDGIENAINHFVSSTDKNLAKMHSMPSGYRLLEVTSLTLITTFIPDIRGGCGAIGRARDKVTTCSQLPRSQTAAEVYAYAIRSRCKYV